LDMGSEDVGSGGQPRLEMLDMGFEEEGDPRLDLFDMGSEGEGSGAQPRLEMLDMEFVNEGSGLQPRLEMLEVELEGSGPEVRLEMLELESEDEVLSNVEIGSAEFRMAELTEASGDDDGALVKSLQEISEPGSGEFRADEEGSAMEDHLSEPEVEAKIVDGEMSQEMPSSSEAEIEGITEPVDDREAKKARIFSKLMKTLGSAVGEIVRIKQSLAEETLKAKSNLSKGFTEAKRKVVNIIV